MAVNRGDRTVALTLLVLFAFLALRADENVSSGNEDRVELTEVDLFSLSGWQHKKIAVDGFTLGMAHSEALKLANSEGLKFVIAAPMPTEKKQKAPCVEGECSVCKENGNWIGLDLFFDSGRLNKIKVSVPIDADRDVKRVNVARRFKGRTFQFFNHYSDSLLNRIFGVVEAKKIPVKVGEQPSNLTNVEYRYPSLGMVVRTTIDTRDNPPQPFDLEVEFVPPQVTPRKASVVAACPSLHFVYLLFPMEPKKSGATIRAAAHPVMFGNLALSS